MAAQKKHTPAKAALPAIGPRPANWSHEQSVFWKQVSASDNYTLKVALGEIVSGSKALATQVARELPLFTRHDEVHLDNVLYWMEQLVSEEGLQQLGAVGCAVCIVLAYTHDLGMVPEPQWEKRLADPLSIEAARFKQWATQRHADLLDLAEHCRANGAVDRATWIDDFLRADFLRDTHADEGHESRVAGHLRRLAGGGELKQTFGFLGDENEAVGLLSALAASHNRGADWLSRWLERRAARPGGAGTAGIDYWRMHTASGPANLLLPGLLLRLADVCDFERSRTPSILFHQVGLEGFSALGLEQNIPGLADEKAGALKTSVKEWMKHLAVDAWAWTREADNRLAYVVSSCPHPAVERSIRAFCEVIGGEIAGVRAELVRVLRRGDCAWLRLPAKVEPAITTRRGYEYHDVRFHLQAHEVTQLLMGTALYGDPELCIRELLQNALDAVQLRDLRLQLEQKLRKEGNTLPGKYPFIPPADPWTESERAMPVHLEWGRDDVAKRDWIAVRDAGTGMTLDQITRYLAALGRSYYKSPEFGAEARVMRAELDRAATPISQFGIGILSCFMIAEWIEVRTCPCGRNDNDRRAWCVRVTGPGALFHFAEWQPAPGRLMRAGTEVKLHLKQAFAVVDIPQEALRRQLSRELGYTPGYMREEEDSDYERRENGVRLFNPAAAAARQVIWPRYAIGCRRPGVEATGLTLDGAWHFTRLCPLDVERLAAAALPWGCPADRVRDAAWSLLDWEDALTGSRLRVVLPRCGPPPPLPASPLGAPADRARVVELALLSEGQMTPDSDSRQRCLVRGMRVARLGSAAEGVWQVAAGVGAWCWIDLAGAAAPRLTADRGTTVEAEGEVRVAWEREVAGVFDRWLDWTAALTGSDPSGRLALALMLVTGERMRAQWRAGFQAGNWMLSRELALSWSPMASDAAAFAVASLAIEAGRALARDLAFARDLARDLALALDLDRALAHTNPHDRVRAHPHPLVRALDRDRARASALVRASALARDRARDLSGDHAFAFDLDNTIDRASARARARVAKLGSIHRQHADAALLSEGFWPDLARSFPLLRLPPSPADLSAATARAPAMFEWCRVPAGSGEAGLSAIEQRGYDLLLPFSVIATPRWRSLFPRWEQDRGGRRLLTLPFLWPDEELVRDVAQALRNPKLPKRDVGQEERSRIERIHADARELARHTLHVLLPRGELWEKQFDTWTEEDWRWCGYSAQWNLSTGEMLWAVGGVTRDEMSAHGQPLEEFLESKQLADFRAACPMLFPESREA